MITFWQMNLEFYKSKEEHEIDRDHDFNFDWNTDLKLDTKHDLDHTHSKKLNEQTVTNKVKEQTFQSRELGRNGPARR